MFDQTKREWIRNVSRRDTGTGILLGPDQKSTRPAAVAKEFIADITYTECAELARRGGYYHFKWIPKYIADYRQLRNAKCAGGECFEDPEDEDPPCRDYACICHNEKCI